MQADPPLPFKAIQGGWLINRHLATLPLAHNSSKREKATCILQWGSLVTSKLSASHPLSYATDIVCMQDKPFCAYPTHSNKKHFATLLYSSGFLKKCMQSRKDFFASIVKVLTRLAHKLTLIQALQLELLFWTGLTLKFKLKCPGTHGVWSESLCLFNLRMIFNFPLNQYAGNLHKRHWFISCSWCANLCNCLCWESYKPEGQWLSCSPALQSFGRLAHVSNYFPQTNCSLVMHWLANKVWWHGMFLYRRYKLGIHFYANLREQICLRGSRSLFCNSNSRI